MKRKAWLALLFAACCGLGFAAIWMAREELDGWALPAALGWTVLVSKAFAVLLAVAASRR